MQGRASPEWIEIGRLFSPVLSYCYVRSVYHFGRRKKKGKGKGEDGRGERKGEHCSPCRPAEWNPTITPVPLSPLQHWQVPSVCSTPHFTETETQTQTLLALGRSCLQSALLPCLA